MDINKHPVDKAGLDGKLAEVIYDPRPEKIIFIKGDTDVTYQDVIFAMDQARGAGVKVLAAVPKDAAK